MTRKLTATTDDDNPWSRHLDRVLEVEGECLEEMNQKEEEVLVRRI
jgi:hypothetical protein